MLFGFTTGVVCTRCGLSLEEIYLLGGLAASCEELMVLRCMPRVSAKSLLLSGEVLYDVLWQYKDNRGTDMVRAVMAERLGRSLEMDGEGIPVVG